MLRRYEIIIIVNFIFFFVNAAENKQDMCKNERKR